MALPGRPGITGGHQAELWQRWRNGESISDVSRALAADRKSVCRVLRRYGGFTPPLRKRAPSALALAEREEISRGLSAGHSLCQIAKALQRSPSTISREIVRNGGRQRYRLTQADKAAWERSRRPKLCRLAQNGKLRRTVANKAWMGSTHFLTKTLDRVITAMGLHVLAYNIKRAMKLVGTKTLIEATQ